LSGAFCYKANGWSGRVLGGVTVEPELIKKYLFSRLTGPSLSPFNAWVLSKV
jgi:O-succinylhomoserine sulfhydrylase